MAESPARVRIFVIATLACLGAAVGYTIYASRASRSQATKPAPIVALPSTTLPSPSPPAQMSAPSSPLPAPVRDGGQSKPYLISLNVRDSPELGQVEFSALDSASDRRATGLHCERVYFASGKAVCLTRQIKRFGAETIATFTDHRFQPLFDVRTPGIPTRARISPDGRRAAFTVFVTGHSYADAQLSTTTMLVDLTTRETVNLEEFQASKDGNPLKGPDFNYWGVTFGRDSSFFYATLRTGGVNYLVRGDIKARTVNVLHSGVECPSLSPDETRVAFKTAVGRGDWRLAVLDLSTHQEVPLAETRSVDDQVEWLDNARVLYALPDPAPWMTIMVAPADGTGLPTVFAKGASSPTVVRQFRP